MSLPCTRGRPPVRRRRNTADRSRRTPRWESTSSRPPVPRGARRRGAVATRPSSTFRNPVRSALMANLGFRSSGGAHSSWAGVYSTPLRNGNAPATCECVTHSNPAPARSFRLCRALIATLLFALLAMPAFAADAAKTLRVAFSGPEQSFDPQFSADAASDGVIDHIFDAMLDYDYLARPMTLVPRTLVAMPDGDRRRRDVRVQAEARESSSRPIRRSRASRASSPPATTPTRSSACSIPR